MEMAYDKKLSFIHKMAKLGLEHVQHLDVGGPVNPMNTPAPGTSLSGPQTTGGAVNTVNNNGITGTIGNLLGTNNQFQSQSANINPGTNTAQLNNAYTGVNGAIGQQQGITNTLNGQLNNGANAQNQLENMYLNQASGSGPNPAQAELNQATTNNISQQAALAAGQRGAGANAGLIASQNAQQGAATQQNAAGQAATLNAQQQLAAEQNLQNLAASQVTQGQGATSTLNNAQQNEQNILQGANTAANNANVSQQSNLNNVNASVAAGNQSQANNTVSNLLGGVSAAVPFIGSGISSVASAIGGLFAKGGMVKMDKGGNVLDANARKHIAPHNFALPGGRYPIHDINHARNALARVSQYGSPAEKTKVREAVHRKYPSINSPQKMAAGGITGEPTNAPQSFVGQWINSIPYTQTPIQQQVANIDTDPANMLSESQQAALKNIWTQTPVDTSQGDAITNSGVGGAGDVTTGLAGAGEGGASLGDIAVMAANKGGLMKKGGKVSAKGKGEEPEVKGDSLKNDKVPTMLSAGEIVIPRHITMSERAPEKAAEFVRKTLAKKGLMK